MRFLCRSLMRWDGNHSCLSKITGTGSFPDTFWIASFLCFLHKRWNEFYFIRKRRRHSTFRFLSWIVVRGKKAELVARGDKHTQEIEKWKNGIFHSTWTSLCCFIVFVMLVKENRFLRHQRISERFIYLFMFVHSVFWLWRKRLTTWQCSRCCIFSVSYDDRKLIELFSIEKSSWGNFQVEFNLPLTWTFIGSLRLYKLGEKIEQEVKVSGNSIHQRQWQVCVGVSVN